MYKSYLNVRDIMYTCCIRSTRILYESSLYSIWGWFHTYGRKYSILSIFMHTTYMPTADCVCMHTAPLQFTSSYNGSLVNIILLCKIAINCPHRRIIEYTFSLSRITPSSSKQEQYTISQSVNLPSTNCSMDNIILLWY